MSETLKTAIRQGISCRPVGISPVGANSYRHCIVDESVWIELWAFNGSNGWLHVDDRIWVVRKVSNNRDVIAFLVEEVCLSSWACLEGTAT